jgi:hypothetical protein
LADLLAARSPVDQMTDAMSPLKLVGQDKIVVIMPSRKGFDEIDLNPSLAA